MFVPLEVDENLQKIQQQTKAPSSGEFLSIVTSSVVK